MAFGAQPVVNLEGLGVLGIRVVFENHRPPWGTPFCMETIFPINASERDELASADAVTAVTLLLYIATSTKLWTRVHDI